MSTTAIHCIKKVNSKIKVRKVNNTKKNVKHREENWEKFRKLEKDIYKSLHDLWFSYNIMFEFFFEFFSFFISFLVRY